MPHLPALVAGPVAGASLSAIKEMAMLSARIPDAASLTWGVPSFRTPEHIRQAASVALETDPDVGKYALPTGLPALRALAAKHHLQRTGVEVDPERNVLITAGNMQGMSCLLRVLIEPGDEIVMTDPGFASHIQQIRLAGGVPVPWPLAENAGWALQIDALAERITPRTKAVILVCPSNPTGTVFPKADLLRLGQLAEEHGLLVLIDDPYSEIVYEEHDRFFHLASEARLLDRIAHLFTFSKIHAMSGWRVGYAILGDWLRHEVLKVHDATMICVPRISQVAAAAALSGPDAHIAAFRDTFARRRERVCERLDRLSHVFQYVRPQGAYYVFPRIVADHRDSREFCLRLLEEAHVTLTPGSAFGPSGEHHVRMAFCVDDEVIETAFDRLERHFGS
jgi:aspartate/methionine/tyrosine aminotransferase